MYRDCHHVGILNATRSGCFSRKRARVDSLNDIVTGVAMYGGFRDLMIQVHTGMENRDYQAGFPDREIKLRSEIQLGR